MQQAFQDYLLKDADGVSEHISDASGALPEHRLATYYNAYRLRLIDALSVNYPVLQQVMGEQPFETLAVNYLDSHPSLNRSIRWFGDRLPDYLLSRLDLPDHDYLAETAQFEWSRLAVFDAANSPQLVNLEDMASLPAEHWAELHFEFKPAIRLLTLCHNVPQLATAIEANQLIPERRQQSVAQPWLIWRQNHDLFWRSLEPHEHYALETAMQDGSFAAICQGLMEFMDAEAIALTAAGIVKQWITHQLVTKIR